MRSPTAGNKNQGSNWISKKRRLEIQKRDGFRCSYCGEQFKLWSIDHIIPRSKGGSNHSNNLLLACIPCNAKKGNASLEDFVGEKKAKRLIKRASRLFPPPHMQKIKKERKAQS